jgi:hypothetical protein
MGFLDKAKRLAEQAQQKLDEAQNSFNQSAPAPPQPEGGGQANTSPDPFKPLQQ